LENRDLELASARTELLDNEKQIDLLENDLKSCGNSICEAEEKISDLTERLRASFQMDERTNNQELIKLKNDISETLKLEYSDYVKSKQAEYSADMFEVYRAILSNIFKRLRRFGINCE
jgi:chromosome segregation ATPase